MTPRWTKWISAALLLLAPAARAGDVFQMGIAEDWLRGVVIRKIEQQTGARVEMGGFHLDLWNRRVAIDDLTLHGLEGAADPPLLHASHVEVGIRIVSVLGREIALDELTVDQPFVSIRLGKNGSSNIPTPPAGSGSRSWRETLFRLGIARLELRKGSLNFNDQRMSVSVHGADFEFMMNRGAAANATDTYTGNLRWPQVEWKQGGYAPFRFDVSAKFTLHPGAFELDELVWKLPHSELNVRAELASFARPDWNVHYRGRVSLEDVRTIFRRRVAPDGVTDVTGQAHYTSGRGKDAGWTASGHYEAHDIRMSHKYFHASGIESSGDYEVAGRRLVVPHLNVRAFGGTAQGRLEMDFRGYAFRTTTRMRGASLAAILAALDREKFPVNALHWDAAVDVDTVSTWNADFQHFRTGGEVRWTPPAVPAAGMIPVAAHFTSNYATDSQIVSISQSEIRTPKALVQVDGLLGAKDSALEVQFHTDDLLDWNDFIRAIRGRDVPPHRVAGRADWDGRILGPLLGPTFSGHMNVSDAAYDTMAWNTVEGDIEYSPDAFRLAGGALRRGSSVVGMDLSVQLDGDWNFLDSNFWTVDTRFERVSAADLQSVLGTNYPASGWLSGDLHGTGTRAAPVLDAKLAVRDIETRGWHFDSLTGQLHWENGEVRLSGGELRGSGGVIRGDIAYRPLEQQAEFNVTGQGIDVGKIQALQTASVPVSGQFSFDLRGSGPLRALVAEGDLRLANVQLGSEAQGDFRGHLTSDGQTARITLSSSPLAERLRGEIAIGLTGDQPISGRISVAQFDLDALIANGLHVKQLTGHSSADGVFTISGALRQPDSIEVDADIARLVFDYELVQLTNDQPIRLTYRRNEVRLEQVRLHGPDTDLQLSGSARLDRNGPVRFALSGGVNLRLVKGVVPDLDARGRADVNVSVEGTMAQPRVTGRASVRDASANYADFPVGLSKVSGELVFDRSRLLFEKISAEAGGGQLVLAGSVTYGEGPVRYEVTAATSLVRIRYPAGMSWLANGTLQLSGTSRGALLSGRVGVERLLFAQGVDVVSFFAAASQSSSSSPEVSPFLQNLAFDVEGQSNPGARIEWAGARVEMDGNVRLRGTWDRPVLLGHIHLLGGQMAFRGNAFELTRGDIDFANPFRLDPDLNVEAVSTINQYQVTIDFTGAASQLAMNYRSEPPLPDSDIVALLALGSTGEAGGFGTQPGGSQSFGATALLSEAISTGVGGRIERLFGISQFRVDPFVAGTATEPNAAARVTIQQHVARDLTITYSTNAATSNQYQMIQVEYTVKRDLSVIFLRDVNGTYGMDIKWVRHFK